jgi:predicted RNA polymerase sigma factor
VAPLAAVFADPEIASDAADEAIVRAFERWERVSVMASPEGWTFRWR